MVQSIFVPSLISIEAFFIVSQQFELVTGGFSVKTAIFHNMLMRERVKDKTLMIFKLNLLFNDLDLEG
jgi:hypothetical protein